MNEWARLVDKYASELKKYELICSFCGQHLDDSNVNSECSENINSSQSKGAPAKSGYGSQAQQQNQKFEGD